MYLASILDSLQDIPSLVIALIALTAIFLVAEAFDRV